MALDEQPDDGGGIPEWVVTFGDMMSLLLTFFIMLVSMSEIKEEEKYQAMVNSIRKQFGHSLSIMSMTPGPAKPRNSKLADPTSMGRARRLDIHRGGNKVQAPVGDENMVTIVRRGSRTAVGTALIFQGDETELSPGNQENLRVQAGIFDGKPQKIEVRGHTSLRPVEPNGPIRDNDDLAYQRARNTKDALVALGIDPQRIRISVAGQHEPLYGGTDLEKLKRNGRVEVFLLDALVEDLKGTDAETPTP